MVDWRHNLEQKWNSLHFGEVKVDTRDGQRAFEVQVYLNDLNPNAVRVELYADGVESNPPLRQELKTTGQLDGVAGGDVYRAAVSATRPAADYTARLMPQCDGVAVPLEDARILWQR